MHATHTSTHVMAVARFERFFREVASLDVDKDDIKRFDDFINRKLSDMIVRAEAVAKANLRDVIQPQDLPITKGLQERIQEFKRTDQEIELRPILDELAARPPSDLALGDETEAQLPDVVGGLSVALARAFKIVDPELKNPRTEQWERSFRLFDLLL
jgi:hypothetical protein